MSQRARLVVQWLKYAEYVLVWVPIAFADRPKYEAVRDGEDWRLVCR